MSVKTRICLTLTLLLALGATGKQKAKAPAPALPSPTFSLPGGVYTNNVLLNLNSPSSSAMVHYTLDGSEPTESSPVASARLLVTNCVVVRARAFDREGVSAAVSQTYVLVEPDVIEFSSNLPLVIINSFGRELERDDKCVGALRVIEKQNGRATLLGAADFDGRAVMNVRGRASLRYLKRSYTVKLIGDDDDYAAASILGMPAEWDWILYAPYPDKTLMRDVLAYELHEQMGHWAPRTRFIEVFVNQEIRKLSKADYVGVYVLEERIKRDKNRVDLKKLDPDDNSEPKLTGGYIFKKDHSDLGYFGQPDLTGGGAVPSTSSNRFGFPTGPGGFPASPAGFLAPFTGRASSSSSSSSRSSSSRRSRPLATTNHVGVPQRNEIEISRSVYYTGDDEYIVQKEPAGFRTTLDTNHFYFVEPEPDEITAVQKAWLKTHLNDVEAALYGPDFKDAARGYRAFLEVDSFIDYHLIVEVTKNVDGFRFSTFFSKDRGGKLRMEPIWDWNLSFGNANGKQGWIPEYWLWPQLDDREYTWFRRLFEDPDFGQRYVDRWARLRTNVFATSILLARVDALAALLDEAQKRNFERWPILGLAVNPNMFVGQTYREEVDWMKGWISNRLDWIEKQFVAAPVAQVEKERATVMLATVMLRAPAGKIYYTLDGSDPRASGGAPAASAKVFASPIPASPGTRLFARALDGTRWSAPTLMNR